MIRAATTFLAVLLAGPAWGQQDATPDPVLQAKIDDAIRKGVAYLKTAESVVAWQEFGGNSDELILWTFVHADVSTRDPVFQTLLQRMLSANLTRTYKVALQAMILEEIDRVVHQPRIWQCAQFPDRQPVAPTASGATGRRRAAAQNPPPPTRRTSRRPRRRRARLQHARRREEAETEGRAEDPVQRTKPGPATGDNSNSQYAALGLRACQDAGIKFPREALALSRKWWLGLPARGRPRTRRSRRGRSRPIRAAGATT
jgi:hypothetical protein